MNEPSESATSISHVATLLADLGSDSAVARNRAHQELVLLREAAVEPLIGALCTSTEYGRGQAAKALGEIGDSSAAPALAEALADDKFDVRWLATRAVVLLGRAGLTALLQALIERPHSTLLRESAHNVLHDEAQKKWSRQIDPVTRALESPDPEAELPMAATNALQAIKNLPMQS
jgi:HEAT repeat protein